MTIKQAIAFLEAHDDEFLKFDRVVNKVSSHPDLHVFLVLATFWYKNGGDIIGSAEHDEIFLAVPCEKVLENMSENTLLDLHRAGLRINEEYDCFAMFV